jgi:hypothetical protein
LAPLIIFTLVYSNVINNFNLLIVTKHAMFFLYKHGKCHNPNFRLATKARACKSAGQEWAQELHFMLMGVQESVREWTPTLPSELPLWELESQWVFEFLKGNYRGQNSLDWQVFYIIEKILERRCLKWTCMTHLGP